MLPCQWQNAVCERLHQSMGNALRVLNYSAPPSTAIGAEERVNSALQTAAYAARTAMHTTMKESPGTLAFHRDMLLNIPLLVDFELIRQRRQALIDKNLLRANAKRVVGNWKLLELLDMDKTTTTTAT